MLATAHDVTLSHIDYARSMLRKAMHWMRFFPAQLDTIAAYGRKAGEYAYYSGRPLVVWFADFADVAVHDGQVSEVLFGNAAAHDGFLVGWFSAHVILADDPART